MKHVIFDLDGTLTDSGEGIINSVLYAYEKLGIRPPEAEDLRRFVGPPLTESFAKNRVPKDRIDEAVATYRVRYDKGGGKYENKVYEGIRELLAALKAMDIKLYVGTSKPEFLAKDILAKFELDGDFEVIAGASGDLSRETKTQVLEYLLEKINTEEEKPELIMVGDTKYDVIGAKDLDIPCIGVSWGYGSISEMEEAGAVGIAKTTDELFAMILR